MAKRAEIKGIFNPFKNYYEKDYFLRRLIKNFIKKKKTSQTRSN